jgi:hypothetical protein
VQATFAEDFRPQLDALTARFPGEVLHHLEWTARDPARATIGVGGIPLIRYTTPARFDEILAAARALGIGVGHTHTFHLTATTPEGTAARHALKHAVDPRGLLNPGKMSTFPLNPFASAPS